MTKEVFYQSKLIWLQHLFVQKELLENLCFEYINSRTIDKGIKEVDRQIEKVLNEILRLKLKNKNG